ncbi:ABC transporter ATP-binding protein [Longimicrobium sp.]|jgi:lipoprotein-releasing system ATP-binding protein|uniref:ABC transporter ATP-binding protein n=1 Tax=Longimicrobium sp. TaxID=2029185 RepID=UPI002EDA1FD7
MSSESLDRPGDELVADEAPMESAVLPEPTGDAAPRRSFDGVEPSISARGVRKSYVGGDGTPIHVLDGVDLDVRPGEMVSVIGASGSGKSTLLHVLGALDRPDEGAVSVGGVPVATLNEQGMAELRAKRVGFVFQFHHLLREFSALENVMMPQLIAGTGEGKARERARELLDLVGLAGRLEHKPSQLSGGEQQRVAVARALANRPLVLLADEPSGNLDPSTSDRLHEHLFRVCREEGAAMVLVTHDLALAARADRVLRLLGGQLVDAGPDAAGAAA